MSLAEPMAGEVFRDFLGRTFTVIGVAREDDSRQQFVFYKDPGGRVFCRTLHRWCMPATLKREDGTVETVRQMEMVSSPLAGEAPKELAQ
jgi:hypothetical protein